MLITTVDMIAEQCGGELLIGDGHTTVSSLAIDSRSVRRGSVFVAFSGANTNGHDYLARAIEAGATALIVTRDLDKLDQRTRDAIAQSGVAVIKASNALDAVSALGKAHRNRFRCPVIGVTGSTGKTTTKDFLAAILGARYNTVATEKNHNNELGVPLTLLSGTVDTEAFVIEMGMRAKGEIADLCAITRPTMGLITNVGTSHIEFLGSEKNIAAAKAELLESLDERGRAFINGDDIRSDYLKTFSRAPITTYGLAVKCDVCAERVTLDEAGCATFTAICENEEPFEVTLNVPGKHNVYNALAALAVGYHCGVPTGDMARALKTAVMTPMRMEIINTAGGVTIINDTYNANPTSMRAAIETLVGIAHEGKKVAVLGGMGELGSLSNLAHFDLGKYVAERPIDHLVVVGELARRIGDGAAAAQNSQVEIHVFDAIEDAAPRLSELIRTQDAVLVKASRAIGLEALVERIVSPRV